MAAPEAVDGEAEKNYEEREGDLTSLSVHEKTERERERARCRESARGIWYLKSPIFLKAQGLLLRTAEEEGSREAVVLPDLKGVRAFPRPLKYE